MRSYHHGGLKSALVEAALTLLKDRPAEAVAVNDAARALGVSTAAPYRHFADRDELLSHVAARGFDMLRAEMEARMAGHPRGSIARIVAGGCAYIAFGAAHPSLFHLMWGATRLTTGRDVAEQSGGRCYETFTSNLSETMAAEGFGSRAPSEFGAPLWTMVHGYASLMIGGAKHLSNEIMAVEQMAETATRAYFAGLKTMDPARAVPPVGEPVDRASAAGTPLKGQMLDPNRDGCAAFNLRRASRAVTRRFEQIMRPVELTAFQFTALVMLSERDGLTQSRMADLFDMSLSTLNRNIAPIARRGLVSIEADAEDARRRCVFLTPAGRAILDEALPLWRDAQGWALGRMGADAWQDVRRSLKHLST
ncbi:MAG: WHG domain-containing protein [Pseudomonadota bacterium]